MHNKLYCWAHSFIHSFTHSRCKYEPVGRHSRGQKELFDQIPASNKQDLNTTVCVCMETAICCRMHAADDVVGHMWHYYFLTSKDELCEEFHKSSADVKESGFKTDCGQKLTQRGSTQGKFSEWDLCVSYKEDRKKRSSSTKLIISCISLSDVD